MIITGKNPTFRAAFILHPPSAESHEAAWPTLVKICRKYLLEKFDSNDLLKGWFFTGGSWHPPGTRSTSVKTSCAPYDQSPRAPRHWAMRFSHHCEEARGRIWTVDVGISLLDDNPPSYRIAVAVFHYLIPGYLGERPEPPSNSIPKIFWSLFRAKGWQAWDGVMPLETTATRIQETDCLPFIDLLRSPGRVVPVVLLDFDEERCKHPTPHKILSRKLAGMARVAYATDEDARQELFQQLGREFACPRGGIRVYEPRVNFDRPQDALRHRFLSAAVIDDCGEREVLRRLFSGLATRPYAIRGNVANNLEDIIALRRAWGIENLRKTASTEDEYLELIDQLDGENKALQEENQGLNEQIQDLELEKLQLTDEATTERHKANQCMLTIQEMSQSQGGQNLILNTPRLPETLAQVVELLAKAFSGQVVFLESAQKSAQKATFDDINEAWRVLHVACRELPNCYFEKRMKPDQVRRHIESNYAGISIALTETSATMADSRLRRLRTFEYAGEKVLFAAHLSIDKRGQWLRIHFHPDHQRQKLVIGHCGDHLETVGTRRKGF